MKKNNKKIKNLNNINNNNINKVNRSHSHNQLKIYDMLDWAYSCSLIPLLINECIYIYIYKIEWERERERDRVIHLFIIHVYRKVQQDFCLIKSTCLYFKRKKTNSNINKYIYIYLYCILLFKHFTRYSNF